MTKNEKFIKKSMNVHGNKYNYTLVNYINNISKVVIICPTHGEFTQSPSKHMSGQGCPECGRFLDGYETKFEWNYLLHNVFNF